MKTILVPVLCAMAAIGGARFGYVAGLLDGRRQISELAAYKLATERANARWRLMAVRAGAAHWVRDPRQQPGDNVSNLIEWDCRQELNIHAAGLLPGAY